MILLPAYLQKFENEANAFLKSELKHKIIVDFIEDSYKVSIPDNNLSLVWQCFFNLTRESEIINPFCSCPDGDVRCIHMAIAYLFIHRNYLPFHVSFEKNFFYILFQNLYAVFEKALPVYKENAWITSVNDISISIRTSSQTSFNEIKEVLSFNENSFYASVKSSIFSSEEILSWENTVQKKETKYFSLSVWYFLAKFCFLQSLSKNCLTSFYTTEEDGFPKKIILSSENFSFSFYVNEEILSNCLPFLDTISSNVKLWPQTQNIISISKNSEKDCLSIEEEFTEIPKAFFRDNLPNYRDIKFVKEIGFFLKRPQSYDLHSQEILSWLAKNNRLLPFVVHSAIHNVSYEFHFDMHANLHCSPFLFESNDMKNHGLIINRHLLFLANKGFYFISGLFNSENPFIIPNQKIEHYLDEYPDFFKTPGFTISLTSPDTSALTFSINDNGSLLFFYPRQNSTTSTEVFHFGKWIYHADIGFFLNKEESCPIKNGTIIKQDNIAQFIDQNYDSLQNIDSFFKDNILFNDIVIKFSLVNKKKIILTAFLNKEAQLIPCKIFHKYLFIEGEGCSPLIFEENSPLHIYSRELSGSLISNFYNQELKQLKNEISFSTLNITPPKTYELSLISLIYDSQNQLLAEFKLATDIGSVPLNDILSAVKSKNEFLFSQAGYINLSDPALQLISYLNEKEDLLKKGYYLSVIDILKLDALFPIKVAAQASQETHANFTKIKEYCIPHPPELTTQHQHLRPYQKNGLLWLWFLYYNGISGLLCDEMGLGKTHQAMSLINTCALTSPTPKLFLVVCPTSVLMHWVTLLHNYCSSLSTFFFHTKTKKLTLPDHGVIITSYGMIRHQYTAFYNKQIEIAIFDEIQLAKNKTSQIHKILCRLNAKMKLGLTGTPIENNVQELKALFDIVLPGYLPSEAIFKQIFSASSNSNQIKEKNRVLKIIKPFLLRRTKNNVLPELPDKIENDLICYLSPEQKQLYSNLIEKESHCINDFADNEREKTVSYVHIFALLNHLKQICNHPSVFLKNPQNYKQHHSGKWNIFVDLLNTNLANGNKVVIFSQYLIMIEIISSYLKEQNIQFAVIHGKSQNRQKEVDSFQNDPNCKVFLGSLLASGVGINLTSGNVVIMYDRWWNPAKENQALDRVHRIGQKNTVFIYKLITADTIEEKINWLIQQKKQLFNEIIPNHEAGVLKMLNKEDLLEILNYKSIQEEEETDL